MIYKPQIETDYFTALNLQEDSVDDLSNMSDLTLETKNNIRVEFDLLKAFIEELYGLSDPELLVYIPLILRQYNFLIANIRVSSIVWLIREAFYYVTSPSTNPSILRGDFGTNYQLAFLGVVDIIAARTLIGLINDYYVFRKANIKNFLEG